MNLRKTYPHRSGSDLLSQRNFEGYLYIISQYLSSLEDHQSIIHEDARNRYYLLCNRDPHTIGGGCGISGGDGASSSLVRTTTTLEVVFAISMIFVDRIHSLK